MPIELPPGMAAQRDDRNPPPRNSQVLVFVGLFSGLVILLIWLAGAIVNQIVWWIPPSVERQLGAIAVPAFERMAQPSDTQTALNQLLDRLEAELPAEQQSRDYQVLYVPDPTVNALAIPGDRIVIFKGLLDQVESENELAMVLSHELGHFANRDHLRSLGRTIVVQLALASLFGDLGSLQRIAVAGIEQLTDAQYSQSQERQADEFGLDLLYDTYGQVAGATDFFARLGKGRDRSLTDFVATHPAPQARVKRLRELIEAENYPVETRSPLPPALENPQEQTRDSLE